MLDKKELGLCRSPWGHTSIALPNGKCGSLVIASGVIIAIFQRVGLQVYAIDFIPDSMAWRFKEYTHLH